MDQSGPYLEDESVQEELGKLLELQDIDLRIRKLDEEIADGQASLGTIQNTIDGYLSEIEDLKERLDVVGKEKQDVETELEDETTRLKDRQTKLMNVQTNREYQSLLKEIEETKAANKRREEEVERYIEIAAAMEAKIIELGEQAEQGRQELAAEEHKVEQMSKELEEQKTKIASERDGKIGAVSKGVYRRYEQLRDRRGGTAIVGVTDGVCQGCYMNIPPQQFNEVLRGDQLHTCPSCQRMMYHLPASEEE